MFVLELKFRVRNFETEIVGQKFRIGSSGFGQEFQCLKIKVGKVQRKFRCSGFEFLKLVVQKFRVVKVTGSKLNVDPERHTP